MKKNTTDKVTESIFEHYDYAKSHNYNIVALFLQGSQNYGLETHLSDVDTKGEIMILKNDLIAQKYTCIEYEDEVKFSAPHHFKVYDVTNFDVLAEVNF